MSKWPPPQPFRPFVKDILEPQVYPDMRWFPGGPPIPPYDVAGYTLSMQMGVKALRVASAFDASLTPITKAELPAAKVDGAGTVYVLGHETNDSLIALNRLMKAGVDVYWSDKPVTAGGREFQAGAMLIPARGNAQAQVAGLAKDLSLPVYATSGVAASGLKIKPIRIALYNPWGGNMDEGWIRWMFEQYEFPFTEVRQAEIRAGSLKDRFDVVVLAEQSMDGIIKGIGADTIPPEYAGGIGNEGVAALKTFVEAGGTLSTVGDAGELAIKGFGLPVKDVLEGLKEEVFFCPGSILEIEVDNSSPVGYGMPSTASAFFARSSAYEVLPAFGVGEPKVVAKYAAKDVVQSGWILGDKFLTNKAAVVDVPWGKGHVVLFGFKVENRAQPHGTFKLFFTSRYFGSAAAGKAAPPAS